MSTPETDSPKPGHAPHPLASAPAGKAPIRRPQKDLNTRGEDLRAQVYIEDGALLGLPGFLQVKRSDLPLETDKDAHAKHERLLGRVMRNQMVPYPDFFEQMPQGAIAATLGAHVFTSQDARVQDVQQAIRKIGEEEKNGTHPDIAEWKDRYNKPWSSLSKILNDGPDIPPAVREWRRNAAKLYLLVDEALKTVGRPDGPDAYVHEIGPEDIIPGRIARKLNMSLKELTDLLQEGGLNGFAEHFKIDPTLVDEISQVVDMADDPRVSHGIANNVIESWKIGHEAAQEISALPEEIRNDPQNQLPDIQSVEDKVAFGIILKTAVMTMLVSSAGSSLPEKMPADVVKKENEIVALFDQLPQELRDALKVTGTEFVFTSGNNLAAMHPGNQAPLGFNLSLPFTKRNNFGLRLIATSNMDRAEYLNEIMKHEVFHTMFQASVTPDQLERSEQLFFQGADRLKQICGKLDDWLSANHDKGKRQAIENDLAEQFGKGDATLAAALPKGMSHDDAMLSLRDKAHRILSELDPDSPKLRRGYPIPELRAAEVFARAGAIEYATMRGEHDTLNFLMPEWLEAVHGIYLPYIKESVAQIREQTAGMNPAIQHLGLPPDFVLPNMLKTVEHTPEQVLAGEKPTARIEQPVMQGLLTQLAHQHSVPDSAAFR